jgi:hypothetical protein
MTTQEKNEILIARLRHQRDLLSELVGELETKSALAVEDYAYCESCADEVSKAMGSIRRFALDKMIQGAPWFQTVKAS